MNRIGPWLEIALRALASMEPMSAGIEEEA
jgi:hypothetical protein